MGKSERQTLVESEVEAKRFAEWIDRMAPSVPVLSNLLDLVDSEEQQQFLEQHGEELAQRLMRIADRLGHDDRVSFASGVAFGILVADCLKQRRLIAVPDVNLKGPIESGV